MVTAVGVDHAFDINSVDRMRDFIARQVVVNHLLDFFFKSRGLYSQCTCIHSDELGFIDYVTISDIERLEAEDSASSK